jgi:glycerol-3-phosphate acyltransferase PlsY
VVIGHNWPVTLHFKGGKGVATTIGVGVAINPGFTLIGFLTSMVIIYVFRMVSLASLEGIFVGSVLMMLFDKSPLLIKVTLLVLFFLSIYQHRANIKRILNGTESKIFERKAK